MVQPAGGIDEVLEPTPSLKLRHKLLSASRNDSFATIANKCLCKQKPMNNQKSTYQ
jgi:hypothetical protein